MTENEDYFVRLVEFPKGTRCHGALALNDDGTYSVYIDKNATDEQKARSLAHELNHIRSDDIHGDKRITDIEEHLATEKRDYFTSWIDWMEWARREMIKKGIKPMEI